MFNWTAGDDYVKLVGDFLRQRGRAALECAGKALRRDGALPRQAIVARHQEGPGRSHQEHAFITRFLKTAMEAGSPHSRS
jgi:hypothetical protein